MTYVTHIIGPLPRRCSDKNGKYLPSEGKVKVTVEGVQLKWKSQRSE
jgi:hypothetical protein